MLEFADEIELASADWSTWSRNHPRQPIWLAEIGVSDGPARAVGCFVVDARTALGLRPWDDADEGAHPDPWVLFDIEKLVRMALHQSGLAFEALISHRTWGDLPARRMATAAVTRQILDYYLDVTAPLEGGATDHWRWRALLTGVLLAREGVASVHVPTLATELHVAEALDAGRVSALRAELAAPNETLPEQPADYDFLDELIVAQRLGAP